MSGCGKLISAECVSVDNPQFKSVDNNNCGEFAGQVLRELDAVIYKLQKDTDVSKLKGQELGIDSRTSTLLSVIQTLIGQVVNLNNEIKIIKSSSSELSILNTPVTIDGSCLSLPNCTSGDSYTLGQLLVALVNSQCSQKASSPIYQPEKY
jgi:hypothetical protein